MSDAPVPQLILDADVAALAVRLTFNGVVLSEIGPGEPVRYAARLGGWARDGVNRLDVAWRTPVPQKGAPRLIVTVRETLGEAERTLLRFERPVAAPPAGQFGQEVPFRPVRRWRWLDADRLPTLTPADRAEIGALLGSIHAMMVARDRAGLLAAQEIQVGEQAIASGSTPAQSLAAYDGFLTERMGAGWKVEPLDAAALRMTPMANGQVVEVTGPSGGPAILARSAAGIFAMMPFVARLGGVWQIVR